jgi:dCMP deaminase
MTTDKEYRYQELYMDVAERVGKMSHAKRRQVGSIIIKDGRIISMGWNGMPAGWDNVCEEDTGLYGQPHFETKKEVLHAETNAIAKLAKSTESGAGAVMYCTDAPCMDCAKLIYQSGIIGVIYREPYKIDDGIRFLKESNVAVERMIDHRTDPKMLPEDPPSVFNGGLSMNEQYEKEKNIG